MSTSEFTAAASRLCTACGMCCNGVLFHIVRLQPMDSVRALESLGMKINRKKKEPYFNQPCKFLHDCTCSIYADRPSRCRLFECRQIQGLQAGVVTEQAAAGKISEARLAVGKLNELLEVVEANNRNLPLMERCSQAMEAEGCEDPNLLREQLAELNALLAEHFLPESTGLGIF